MLRSYWLKVYWTTNKEPLFGYEPGKLIVYNYQGGGGFAAAPEILYVGLTEGIAPNQLTPEQAEWPSPGIMVEYRVGGRQFNGYHYKRKEV